MKGQRWLYDLKTEWTGFSEGSFYSESIQTDEWNHSSELDILKSPNKSEWKSLKNWECSKVWQLRALQRQESLAG